jgi:hypothetical protein
LTLNVNGQSKPLKGFYVKIFLLANQYIYTEDIILHTKTVPPDPTTWLFAEVDTNMTVNIARIDWDQVARFKFNFKLYYDYYEYWNFYNSFRLKITPIFSTDWVDICGDDGFRMDNGGIAYMIASGISTMFGIDISQVQVSDYY